MSETSSNFSKIKEYKSKSKQRDCFQCVVQVNPTLWGQNEFIRKQHNELLKAHKHLKILAYNS